MRVYMCCIDPLQSSGHLNRTLRRQFSFLYDEITSDAPKKVGKIGLKNKMRESKETKERESKETKERESKETKERESKETKERESKETKKRESKERE